MRKVISIAGLISVIFYLSIVLKLYLDTKECEETHAMFCAIGYVIAGFPWTWAFLTIADAYLKESQPDEQEYFLKGVFFAAVLLNSVILYLIGRYVGKVVTRRKVNLSSTGQPNKGL